MEDGCSKDERGERRHDAVRHRSGRDSDGHASVAVLQARGGGCHDLPLASSEDEQGVVHVHDVGQALLS